MCEERGGEGSPVIGANVDDRTSLRILADIPGYRGSSIYEDSVLVERSAKYSGKRRRESERVGESDREGS